MLKKRKILNAFLEIMLGASSGLNRRQLHQLVTSSMDRLCTTKSPLTLNDVFQAEQQPKYSFSNKQKVWFPALDFKDHRINMK